jgi:hypothetical protein
MIRSARWYEIGIVVFVGLLAFAAGIAVPIAILLLQGW